MAASAAYAQNLSPYRRCHRLAGRLFHNAGHGGRGQIPCAAPAPLAPRQHRASVSGCRQQHDAHQTYLHRARPPRARGARLFIAERSHKMAAIWKSGSGRSCRRVLGRPNGPAAARDRSRAFAEAASCSCQMVPGPLSCGGRQVTFAPGPLSCMVHTEHRVSRPCSHISARARPGTFRGGRLQRRRHDLVGPDSTPVLRADADRSAGVTRTGGVRRTVMARSRWNGSGTRSQDGGRMDRVALTGPAGGGGEGEGRPDRTGRFAHLPPRACARAGS